MSLPIDTLLPLYGLVVTLQFTESTRLNFFHQLALAPFIRFLLNSPAQFDSLIRIDACEAGRLFYQAGDYYRFAVYGLNGSEALLQTLIRQLQNLPFSVEKNDKRMPFRRNCRLIALHDAFSTHLVSDVHQLTPYTNTDLTEEAALWQNVTAFKLHLFSPTRLLKEAQSRQHCRNEERFCKQITDLTTQLTTKRLHDHFAALLNRAGEALPINEALPLLLLPEQSEVFWLNLSYSNNEQQQKSAGGMLGEICFQRTATEFDCTPWVLGQYTGFGQRACFGLGGYRLETQTGEYSFRRVFPAHSLLQTMAEEENLQLALEHINSNVDAEAVSADDTGEMEAFWQRLHSDIAKLEKGQFEPPPLQGFVLENPDKSLRALAVPPFRDRVLQRAVVQILQPAVDSLHYQHSYGYRIKRSRSDARYAIQTAWREGYRWVFESDIADFFDSISWQRLAVRLKGLWGDEPLVAAVLQWIQAPIEFEGQLIRRQQGLAQGSPLSPLLANIMLDDFDNDMQLAGFKLIRFADDFVVLCKSQEQAQRAQQAATAFLAEHGLALNQDKTHIARMEDGFYYLGYLFVNDMVLDSPKRLRPQSADKSLSPHSWLSQIKQSVQTVKPLKATPVSSLNKQETCQVSKTWQVCVTESGEREDDCGLLLCVTGQSCILRTQEQRLQVERDAQTLYDIPWRQLQAVLLLGQHHITTPALHEAMALNVPVHFASQTGQYQGVVWNGQTAHRGSQLWLKQQQIFAHPEFALSASRTLVEARLFNMRETLRQRGKSEYSLQFDNLMVQVAKAGSVAELNGFEGTGARWYFSVLKTLLPEEFGFDGRNRQPPLDPFNGLLSLGFSMLYSCVESVLRSDGLLPWTGVYHQPHGKHATLASDSMEPFRHVVESLALTLINRRQLKKENFYFTEQQACYLQKEARNFYLAELMAKFEEKKVFELIHQQNLSLIGYIEKGDVFKAWRMR